MVGKRLFIFIFLFIFLIVSIIYINPASKPERSSYHSSQLKKINSILNENMERTDYVDEKGIITIPADLGYSTIITSRTAHSKLEKYYDDQGKQMARRYSGYYGIYREYDENGNTILVEYLDIDGKPTMISDGYSKEIRKYNVDNGTNIIRYYDAENHPVSTALYGYGQLNEYDENNKNIKTTYLDAFNNPMITEKGYASITRRFYVTDGPENGKVESELYYDEKGAPISLSLGQYGIHKEYDENGRVSLITYLSADGMPIKTNKGYTTVVMSFYANDYPATEQYYDIEGKPYVMSEGQYGIRMDNEHVIYLNQNGEEMFNLKNFLSNSPHFVIVITVFVVIISALTNKKNNIFLFVLCVISIVYFTLLFREKGDIKKIELLWYYKKLLSDSNARADILKNMWLFIPFGAILYQLFPGKMSLLVPVFLSVIIESMQYLFGLGICELDDIISNSIGGCIGYFVMQLTTKLLQRTKLLYR